ncbi:MAG: hypothetical protein M1130_12445 [Actinobacteria bacterium]|nr:hypothetical protein [Actinomycetota bacterium]
MSTGKRCPYFGDWNEDCNSKGKTKWEKQDRAMVEVYCKKFPDYAKCPRFLDAEQQKIQR